MATERINSIPSNNLQVVEKLDSDIQFTPADSGKLFMIEQTAANGAFTTTLPKLSTNLAGWSCLMIRRVHETSNGTLSIVPFSGDEDTVFFNEHRLSGSSGSSTTTDPADGVTLVAYATLSDAIVWIKVSTNGARWFIEGFCINPAGTAIIGS